MREYIYLAAAIAAEVTGTTALKFSDGFSALVPTTVVLVAYIGSFYLLSLTLQELPIGLVYATWSAVGIVGAAAIGLVLFDETVDVAGVAGILLIIAGVAVLNLMSETYSPAA
ncbi:multidrug efflux SMR transporter [Haloarcula sp. S1CR25-12]|uniref:Multidrug efflux SMR transporter n=1 Tax=Haloarcula saliterrae TaxID=2950534 RepID=A0ABU2FCX4_9EURY|nr:multidrug efflux SMR transporter [Haloarcula sp. S1CR25-12]MDS0260112.1 multidrug efflux SMR transporter [Haloarcula sp. S1CR25-12]